VSAEAEAEAERPDAVAKDKEDGKRHQESKERRVGEAGARPAAMKERWIVRPDVQAEQLDAVDVPLGQHVRAERPQVKRQQGDTPAKVTLDRVRLEVVRGPAHGRSCEPPYGQTAATSTPRTRSMLFSKPGTRSIAATDTPKART
jgi:hypothetical protein